MYDNQSKEINKVDDKCHLFIYLFIYLLLIHSTQMRKWFFIICVFTINSIVSLVIIANH
ncbi:MAG: hypothetical protein N7Q72_04575 [Spiroplasma sp. Tabriz.8]|nr:hypothetical protein [Spiroplasma sp. Tabriz.8]